MAADTKLAMSLVAYPDSGSDSDDEGAQFDAQASPRRSGGEPSASLKRKRKRNDVELPPLPSAFLDLYSTNARSSTSDDPSLHGGRKRAVPHVEGNWPSHVYLEWIPSQTEAEALHKLIAAIQTSIVSASKKRSKQLPVPDITPSLLSPLETPLPLHISLSRTLQIRTEDRERFLDTLRSELKKSAVKPFPIWFRGLKWVPNFQRNRWFLVLGIVKPPDDELNRILEACNDAAEKCGHPGLYTGGQGDGPMEANTANKPLKKRPKSSAEGEHISATLATSPIDRSENFHISIAWNLIEPAPEWVDLVRTFDVGDYIQQPQTPFEAVKAKIGNTIHSIELSSRKNILGKGGGLLGLG
ncbi:hypothetical protein BDV96DRAFT_569345 [Lophiotrema nucula]|uniref:U6 snRNA phosphodiesterase n=1 Tax=Lophiotrema nucula TaxID=690887 RepID=A0A6A5ZIJ6_9PLEO|nr:hypothetical protein BDV96DRAFT_569345 [Lophiotrema nucula]